jgi:pilus assembly protein CpaD
MTSLDFLSRSSRTMLTLSLAALLVPGAARADRFNREVSSIHQPVVERRDHVLDVPAGGLDPVEAARVDRWFDELGLAYGDRVGIVSAGTPASNEDVAAIVRRHGLLLAEGAPATTGAIAPGHVRIVVSRSVASVPGCPDYSQWSQPNFTAASSSNYGCAINSALAAMVADPGDLVRGREAHGPDAETAARAIRAWRDTAPTAKNGLKIESTKGGDR